MKQLLSPSPFVLLGLLLAGCDGLTTETGPLPPVDDAGSGSGIENACGGIGPLTFDDAPATVGDRCGRCGLLACSADEDALQCVEPAEDCTVSIPLGERCSESGTCTSNHCATEPDGTAQDRCAPEGMVFIPAGTFVMGSPETEAGRDPSETQHTVTISRSFFLGRTEVSQGEWKSLSDDVNPAFFQSPAGTEASTDNNNDPGPVEQLDWFSALAFANARSAAEGLPSCYTLLGCSEPSNGWKDGRHDGCTGATFPAGLACTGYRLPTESEWEYAARGGFTTTYPWGDVEDGNYLWFAANAEGRTHAVGGKQPNAWGLRDMIGNVWEWTWDAYGPYPADATDPLGAAEGFARAVRGGGFSSEGQFIRVAVHDQNSWDAPSQTLGFRLARTLP